MLCQEFSFIISIWSSENTVLGLLSPDNKFFREISLFFKCTRKKNRVRAHVRVLECLCTRTPNFYKMRTRTQPYAKILSDAHAPARNSYEFFEVEWGGFENLSWNAGVGWGGDFTSLVGGDLRRLIFTRSSCNREKKNRCEVRFSKIRILMC